MSSNPARKMNRAKVKSAQAKANKNFQQAMGSMAALEVSFWGAINSLPWPVRWWIGVKLTWGRMRPVGMDVNVDDAKRGKS
jgi:hypothetical protein